jgi:hypothetical protein
MDFYESHTMQYEGLMKEMPNMALMVLGTLFGSFFVTFVLQVWVKGSGFAKGFTTGLILSFFILVYYNMYFMASMNLYDWTLAIVDILVSSIMGGITGGVAGLVLGLGGKKKVEA